MPAILSDEICLAIHGSRKEGLRERKREGGAREKIGIEKERVIEIE